MKTCRIEEFEEKPMVPDQYNFYRNLCHPQKTADRTDRAGGKEDRHDFVNDILIRYKNLKKNLWI